MEAAHHGREARTEVALHLKAGRKPSEGRKGGGRGRREKGGRGRGRGKEGWGRERGIREGEGGRVGSGTQG